MRKNPGVVLRGCSGCGESKPESEFYAHPRGGLRSRCIACMNKANIARRANDPAKLIKDAAARERSREAIAQQQSAWRLRHPERAMFMVARQRAKRDGREFSITPADIKIPEVCPLLGVALVVGGGDNSPSIDRKDNTKGYTPDNIWVISTKANAIKGARTIEEAFPCFAHQKV